MVSGGSENDDDVRGRILRSGRIVRERFIQGIDKVWGGVKGGRSEPAPGSGSAAPVGASPSTGGGGPVGAKLPVGESPPPGGRRDSYRNSLIRRRDDYNALHGSPIRAARSLSRPVMHVLEKQMREVSAALMQGNKMTRQMKKELEKFGKLAEEYAGILKGEIQNEAAAMNLSREEAARLKMSIDNLKEALHKAPKALKWYSIKNMQQEAESCVILLRELSSYALLVGGVLVFLGYVELDEPAPFSPKETRAGKLLYDGFNFGLTVNSTCSAGVTNSTITSLLSGEVNNLQSQMFLRRVEDNWNCELGISPGRDVVLSGGMDDTWIKGLNASFNLPYHDGNQRKLVLHYKHPFGSVGGTLGVNASPLLSLRAMFGSKSLSGGCMLDYDAVPGIVRRIAVGGGLNLIGISATAMLEKLFPPQAAGQQPQALHQVTATMHVQASEETGVGVEIIHHLEDHLTRVQAGIEHCIPVSGTTAKFKLTNELHLTGILTQKVGERSHFSLCAMMDLRAPQANPRMGLSISIRA